MTKVASTLVTTAESITATDRCDRCGARAAIRVVLAAGTDLLFCAHHARVYDTKLRQIAVDIVRD
jgi:hypothetical protein